MSAAEITWRSATAVRTRMPDLRRVPDDRQLLPPGTDWAAALTCFRDAPGGPLLLEPARARILTRADPRGCAAIVAAADRVRDGRARYFGYPDVQVGAPPDWHRDPFTGYRWPAVPAVRLDHRTAPADPKWIWELNRLQCLPWLAEAWLFTGDDRYAATAVDFLGSWIRTNPPGIGIAWRGAFECGVRAVSVALTLDALRGYPGLTPELFRDATRMLAAAVRYCRIGRSRFSSANNHLVGELARVATVAIVCADLPPAPRWERWAVAALEAEARRQIRADGTGVEQAVAYQLFTADLLLVVVALLQRRDGRAPAALVDALDRSAGYLAATVGAADPDPRYGDDDEGFAMRLDAAPTPTVRDHLGRVGAVTGCEAALRCGRASPSATWLAPTPSAAARVGGSAVGADPGPADPGSAGPGSADPGPGRYAPDGGTVVLRSGTRRIIVDVGPHGYLSIAAHGHADALSLSLAVDGRDLVTDPGTGSYYAHPDRRAVHRGTRAHATVRIDDADQSVAGGPFLWTRHARVRVHRVDLDRGIVDAEHDGYRRFPDPVTHRRIVLAPPGRGRVVVADLFTGAGIHRVGASWPLHPDLDIRCGAAEVEVTLHDRPVLHLAWSATQSAPVLDVVRGDRTSNLGWYSRHLESREPAWLVGTQCTVVPPSVLVTVLSTTGPTGPVDVGFDGRAITARWCGDEPGGIGYDLASGRVDTLSGEDGIPAPTGPSKRM